MRTADVFTYIYEHAKSSQDREVKYFLIRGILVENLADKADFGSVIMNHESIVESLSNLVVSMSKEYIDANLVEIYNYPEIVEEYKDVVEPFFIQQEEDSAQDDDDDTDTEFEVETNSDSDSDSEEEEHIIDVPVANNDVVNTKLNIILLFSTLTFVVSTLNMAVNMATHITK